jgi:hypothetical protein
MTRIRALENTDSDIAVASDPAADASTAPHDWAGASIAEAQAKAREWADRALELSQSGELEQAALAELQAEMWLTRMLSVQRQLQPGVRSFKPRLVGQYRYPRSRAPIRPCSRGSAPEELSSLPSMDRSTVANSVMLRAWKGPRY